MGTGELPYQMAAGEHLLDLWCLSSLAYILVSELAEVEYRSYAATDLGGIPAPGGPMRIMRMLLDGAAGAEAPPVTW
jgi:hypothetical protein